jgi:predicted nucleotidyltransferase
MHSQKAWLPRHKQAVMNRFVAACQADNRVVAAFLGGSYAEGAADACSDLDFYLITTDSAYDHMLAKREDFIQLLGEPLFVEDFGNRCTVLVILSDGTELELGFGRESSFDQIHGGPYSVLIDKTGILANAVFTRHRHVELHTRRILNA